MRFSLPQRPNRLEVAQRASRPTYVGCHQMNFAASAIRKPTAMANTAICTHRLFAKPPVFRICVSIAGYLPSADNLVEFEHSDMLEQLLSFEVHITKPYRSRHEWRPPRQQTQAP